MKAKYGAAVQLAEPTTAAELKNLAEQLELFDFIPDIHTPAEYGRQQICKSGHFEYDENLADYYDFEKYGLERMEHEHGKFTDSGYISYHGFVSIEEILAGVDCERMDAGMQMQ